MNDPSNTSRNPALSSAMGLWPIDRPDEPDSLSVLTLVLWLVCLTIGEVGFFWRHQRPHWPGPPDQPILARQLQVELTEEALPPSEAPQSPDAPPPPEALSPLIIAQPIAVAAPSPAIAFELPIHGPARVVEVPRAGYVEPPPTTNQVAQRLVFGQAEGKQPAPEYPRLAKRLGQEGTVMVHFTVGPDGRVLAAEAAQPSPWPLLNEAALMAVRQQWRFPSGALRVYDVSIRFELLK